MSEEMKTRIKQFMIDRLQLTVAISELQDDTILFDEAGTLGLDSVDALELVLGLEKEFGVTIPDQEVARKVAEEANEVVMAEARDDPKLRGMGTTMCAVALVHSGGADRIAVVNVGDSRVYRLHDGDMAQLSEDHSLVEDMVRGGRLTPEEALRHPQRNILTKAIGIDADLHADAWEVRPRVGDRYLLCSDGLFNEVNDDRISATLRRLDDPGDAAD